MPSRKLFVRCILSFFLCSNRPSGDPFGACAPLPLEGAALRGKDWTSAHNRTSFTFPIGDVIIIVSGTECCYENIIKRTEHKIRFRAGRVLDGLLRGVQLRRGHASSARLLERRVGRNNGRGQHLRLHPLAHARRTAGQLEAPHGIPRALGNAAFRACTARCLRADTGARRGRRRDIHSVHCDGGLHKPSQHAVV